MKHRRSLFSSARPVARVLLALGVMGAAACGAQTGTDGDGVPGTGEEQAGVAGADADAHASDGSAGAAVGHASAGSSSLPVGAGGSSAVTPAGGSGGGLSTGGTAEVGENHAGAGGSTSDGSAGTGAVDGNAGTGADDGTDGGTAGSSTDDGTAGTGGDGTEPDPSDDVVLSPPTQQDNVTTLAEGTFVSLAISGGNLYTLDRSSDVLARIPTTGGDLEPISSSLELTPGHLIADESHLYAAIWLRPGHTQLWRLPLEGGGFDAELGGVLLGEVPSVAAWAVNSSSLVSLEERPTPSTIDRAIFRTDKAEGGVTPVATLGLMFASLFTLDESAAYTMRGGDGIDSDVVRVDLTSGEITTLVKVKQTDLVYALTAANDTLYSASQKRIGRIADAKTTTLDTTPGRRLIADEDNVYFFNTNGDCTVNGSELYRVPVTGGAAEHLASEPGCITDFVRDADGLYWLTAERTLIRALHWQ